MKSDHYTRARFMVPPAASYQRHEVSAGKLTVFYTYAGVKNPCFVSAAL